MDLPDALAAARAGADFLGYVFYAKSARNMEPEAVRAIVRELRVQFPAVRHVGVMVNETADSAASLRDRAELDFVQLHGSETPETVSLLRGRGLNVIKALRFGPDSPPVDWAAFEADYLLCDTYDPGAPGGTGRAFDHAMLPSALPRERIFLAGGLTPENVAAALAAVRPFAVDVSSGVESAPGRKSHALIQAFLRAVRPEAR